MAKPPYDIGDQVTLQATFTLANGTLVNPTTVTCKVKKPDGSPVVAVTPVTNPATGVFQAVFAPDVAGEHWYRFEGVGAAVAADEQPFIVDPKKVQ